MHTLTILCCRALAPRGLKPLAAGDAIVVQTTHPDYLRRLLRLSSQHMVLLDDPAQAADILARTRAVDSRRDAAREKVADQRQQLADEQAAREERLFAAAEFVAWLRAGGADRAVVGHILAAGITSPDELILACEDQAKAEALADAIGEDVLLHFHDQALAEAETDEPDGDTGQPAGDLSNTDPEAIFAELLTKLEVAPRTIKELAKAGVTTAQAFIDLDTADRAALLDVWGVTPDNHPTILQACQIATGADVVVSDDEGDD